MLRRKILNSLLSRYELSYIISELSKYLTTSRIERIDKVLLDRIKSIEVAFESPSDIHNAMASFRTVEAMGLMQAHVIDAQFKKCKGKKTTQGAHRWLNVNYFDKLTSFLHVNNTLLIGAMPNAQAELKDIPLDKNICLIFGNEMSGLSPKAIESCDMLYRIPIHGMSKSYNLSVSCAMSLHELVQRKRLILGPRGDLDDFELELERAWYYFLSIGMGLSEKILNRKACSN